MTALLCGLCDGGGSLQSWLSFLGDSSQQFLDLSNGAAWVEPLGTRLGAVHDGVTSAMTRLVLSLSNTAACESV